jgi:signal transduction histidine kinase
VSASLSTAHSEDAPLTTCAAIRALSREAAERGLPVDIRGTVSYSQPQRFGGMVLQDATAGVYVDRAFSRDHGLVSDGVPWPESLPRGTLVEVKGVTWSGHFAPVLGPSEIRVLGTGPLPEASPLAFSEALDGRWDCQGVRLRGVVQFAENRSNSTERGRFDLVANGGRIPVESIAPLADPARLVDAEVEARGVAFTYFNNRGELVGVRLEITDAGDLRVLQPGREDPFAAPEVPLSTLRPFSPGETNFHRCRCTGTVTLARPGRYFYLQEAGRGVRVETLDAMPLVPGDRVEAAGFVEVADDFGKLRNAVIRKLGTASRPAPATIDRRRVLGTELPGAVTNAEDTDGLFARFYGHLEKVDLANLEGPRLFVESEGHLVTATLVRAGFDGAVARFEPGSDLRIDGVIRVELASGWPAQAYPMPANFQLLVDAPADIAVVHGAPWWTPRRVWLLLGGICGVLAVTLGWNWLLRRRVELRSAQLAEAMRARRESEVEFEATLRERERLAADLHDTLEQSLTSTALQLEAADALREEAPQRSGDHLRIARQVLARSREEMRRSVWNLRAQAMEGRTLPDALREIVAALGQDGPPTIAVDSEGEARPLPDLLARNLLLLAQEGLTNALKHAAAARIRIGVAFEGESVQVTVEDDGRGFDPAAHPGPQNGHFGLQGMRERMKRLGGVLVVASAPGKGTRLSARAPYGEW